MGKHLNSEFDFHSVPRLIDRGVHVRIDPHSNVLLVNNATERVTEFGESSKRKG